MSFNNHYYEKNIKNDLKKQQAEEVVCVSKGKLIAMLQTLEGFKKQILTELKKA